MKVMKITGIDLYSYVHLDTLKIKILFEDSHDSFLMNLDLKGAVFSELLSSLYGGINLPTINGLLRRGLCLEIGKGILNCIKSGEIGVKIGVVGDYTPFMSPNGRWYGANPITKNFNPKKWFKDEDTLADYANKYGYKKATTNIVNFLEDSTKIAENYKKFLNAAKVAKALSDEYNGE